MDEKQLRQEKALQAALVEKPKSGLLSDEMLDGVSGGAVFTGKFYVATCDLCGWSASFDNKGDYDTAVLILDHMNTHPDCPGTNFVVYEFN